MKDPRDRRWPGRQPYTRASAILPRGAMRSLLEAHVPTPGAAKAYEALERAKAEVEMRRELGEK